MQVFRRFDIGTAKPTPAEQAADPHHMIDIVDPDEDFDAAIKLGYEPPKDFHDWGNCFEYKYNAHNTPLPADVRWTWTRYNNTAAIYDKHVNEGPQWMRDLLSRVAGWRLKTNRYGFPIEQKLFVMYLEHRMRTFQGAFHANPDYAFWYGWSEMVRDLQYIREKAVELRRHAEHQPE